MLMMYLVEHRTSTDNDDSYKVIGIFSSLQKANETVNFYQKEVEGFCLFPSGFSIIPVPVLGSGSDNSVTDLFLITSWKPKDGTEEDIRAEAVFCVKNQAAKYRLRYKLCHPFRKCIVDKYIRDCPEWREGFISS
ncbi:MAG: hypothetical protein IJB86_00295 [Clostridia bacterium]|nr:hypothetical protein [Clostridia bacterium]